MLVRSRSASESAKVWLVGRPSKFKAYEIATEWEL